ncbi:uncharacterized protein BO96DRAFT_349504 [Aspergillus niger CBS 101883]|uniref:Uncharacterized protein n=3 Tax=Aspergillus niger TaxID=5061 RepID=A2R6E7_ASPNC|nr:uncharacterized protein BO96DRAFT_349504 [Aspergillus niger CBS 101883]XP_059602642.1 hypothetical protein An15g07680 [Aspergillus niger]PYH51702.1 hypothetical protein BO96DRAFT_349504 [Aspergillus niger CBS 101883]CAK42655.1 hypothetical protein An15g07680 [Aspergillus niger]
MPVKGSCSVAVKRAVLTTLTESCGYAIFRQTALHMGIASASEPFARAIDARRHSAGQASPGEKLEKANRQLSRFSMAADQFADPLWPTDRKRQRSTQKVYLGRAGCMAANSAAEAELLVSGSNAPIASLASETGFFVDQSKQSVWVGIHTIDDPGVQDQPGPVSRVAMNRPESRDFKSCLIVSNFLAFISHIGKQSDPPEYEKACDPSAAVPATFQRWELLLPYLLLFLKVPSGMAYFGLLPFVLHFWLSGITIKIAINPWACKMGDEIDNNSDHVNSTITNKPLPRTWRNLSRVPTCRCLELT